MGLGKPDKRGSATGRSRARERQTSRSYFPYRHPPEKGEGEYGKIFVIWGGAIPESLQGIDR